MIAVELPPFAHIHVCDATAGLLTVLAGVPRGGGRHSRKWLGRARGIRFELGASTEGSVGGA